MLTNRSIVMITSTIGPISRIVRLNSMNILQPTSESTDKSLRSMIRDCVKNRKNNSVTRLEMTRSRLRNPELVEISVLRENMTMEKMLATMPIGVTTQVNMNSNFSAIAVMTTTDVDGITGHAQTHSAHT